MLPHQILLMRNVSNIGAVPAQIGLRHKNFASREDKEEEKLSESRIMLRSNSKALELCKTYRTYEGTEFCMVMSIFSNKKVNETLALCSKEHITFSNVSYLAPKVF